MLFPPFAASEYASLCGEGTMEYVLLCLFEQHTHTSLHTTTLLFSTNLIAIYAAWNKRRNNNHERQPGIDMLTIEVQSNEVQQRLL